MSIYFRHFGDDLFNVNANFNRFGIGRNTWKRTNLGADTGTTLSIMGDYLSSITLERQHVERYRSTMRG
jgi:hypothetical protein